MRKILLVLLLLAVTAVGEASLYYGSVGGPRNIVGEIVKIKNLWVYVKDERSVDTYRFWVYSNKLKDLQAGDRVRVYFYRDNDAAVSIKKMTVLTCGEGQNLGVISGCDK
jgi:hypothetical protein